MHVQLNQKNADKMLRAAHATNRSVGELVNALLEKVEEIEYIEKMEFKMAPPADEVKPKKRKYSFQNNWIHRF